jgi:hypothetical protein
VDGSGLVFVTELDAEICEEVEVTVCDGELVTELLIGVVRVGVAPSDAEHALSNATIALIMSNPNGLNLALSFTWFPPFSAPTCSYQAAG